MAEKRLWTLGKEGICHRNKNIRYLLSDISEFEITIVYGHGIDALGGSASIG